jgi:hypothetical protein
MASYQAAGPSLVIIMMLLSCRTIRLGWEASVNQESCYSRTEM